MAIIKHIAKSPIHFIIPNDVMVLLLKPVRTITRLGGVLVVTEDVTGGPVVGGLVVVPAG